MLTADAPLRVCAVTGSRAEYGLIADLLARLAADPLFALQVAVTGAHLSAHHGLTIREIEADGVRVDAKVEMLLAGDSPAAISKSIGLGVIGFADAFDRLNSDAVMLTGDRFEMFAAAQAALISRKPILHLFGGDVTEGAFDDALRHCMTKMAHVHFVSNAESAARVRQMGESPDRIFNVGSPGIDGIGEAASMSRDDVEQALGFSFRQKNLLVTFHPVTLSANSAAQVQELLASLHALSPSFGIFFTLPNADTSSGEVARLVREFVAGHDNATAHVSLGRKLYLSLMALIDVVVGNSSSGLYEAPSLGKATVDIGDRQKGRPAARSVLRCAPERGEISAAIARALTLDCRGVSNPYGDGKSVPRILDIMTRLPEPSSLLRKPFASDGGINV